MPELQRHGACTVLSSSRPSRAPVGRCLKPRASMGMIAVKRRGARRIEHSAATVTVPVGLKRKLLSGIIASIALSLSVVLTLLATPFPVEVTASDLAPREAPQRDHEWVISTPETDALADKCAVLTDVSGSTADFPGTQSWFLSQLQEILATYESVAPAMDLVVIAYDEEARVVYSAPDTGNSKIITSDVVKAVISSMGSKEWTNPLPAFHDAAQIEGLACLVHLTDGSLDLPPNVTVPQYVAELLSLADDLGRRGVPVLTVAMTDAAGAVWREVAARTGGAYLLNPDAKTLRKAVAAMIPKSTPTATPMPSPTATPSPSPRATLSPPPSAKSTPSGGIASSPLIWTAGSVGPLLFLAACLAFWKKHQRPRLAGWIIIDEEESNDTRS